LAFILNQLAQFHHLLLFLHNSCWRSLRRRLLLHVAL
jgi:hypothetical protein